MHKLHTSGKVSLAGRTNLTSTMRKDKITLKKRCYIWAKTWLVSRVWRAWFFKATGRQISWTTTHASSRPTSAHTGSASAQPLPYMSKNTHFSSQALEPSPSAMCIVNPSRCFPTGKAARVWLWWGPATFRTTVLISFYVHPTAPFVISLCSKSSFRQVTAQKDIEKDSS